MSFSLHAQLPAIARFLAQPSVATLLAFHPNDLGSPAFQPPPHWEHWWDWPDDDRDPWLLLLQHYTRPSAASIPPDSLQNLIDEAASLTVSRDIGSSFGCTQTTPKDHDHTEIMPSLSGMSPKKAHEVLTMSRFIRSFLASNEALAQLERVVDIGAGQAYLSRTLRDHLGVHVLALDSSKAQTEGAAKKDASSANPHTRSQKPKTHAAPIQPLAHSQAAPRGSLTYVTAKIDSESLLSATHTWIHSKPEHRDAHQHAHSEPEPVLFVALHACGSLTLDILRAFLSANNAAPTGPVSDSDSSPQGAGAWKPRGAVIVGCCYNMMQAEDFPLSAALRTSGVPLPTLNPNHLQLAAQIPSQWMNSAESLRDARLATRKVVWRAMLQEALAEQPRCGGSDADNCQDRPRFESKRVGRLNDSAYTDWDSFLNVVQAKVGVSPSQVRRRDPHLERRIEVFHMLRCILGPVVETLILLDRLAWVQEQLQGLSFTVEMVNLFDQAKGSGRNVAIVISPTGP